MNLQIIIKIIFLICLGLILDGCTSIGTKLLSDNRQGFAGAMIVSDEQQLLLNIVRMQFEDRPIFVNVDTITTSNTFQANLNGDFSYSSSPSRNIGGLLATFFTDAFNLTRGFSLSPNLTYSDSPTITFSPLQGEAWMRNVLKPIPIEDVYLLLSSGWNSEKVMRLVFARIFTMYNESTFSDTLRQRIPDNQKFLEFAHFLGKLEAEHIIYFSTSQIDHVILPKGMALNKVLQDENYSS